MRYICYIEGLYCEWSVKDSQPASRLMSERKFIHYYERRYAHDAIDITPNLLKRMEHAKQYGTCDKSVHLIDLLNNNMAGINKNRLSIEGLKQEYHSKMDDV